MLPKWMQDSIDRRDALLTKVLLDTPEKIKEYVKYPDLDGIKLGDTLIVRKVFLDFNAQNQIDDYFTREYLYRNPC